MLHCSPCCGSTHLIHLFCISILQLPPFSYLSEDGTELRGVCREVADYLATSLNFTCVHETQANHGVNDNDPVLIDSASPVSILLQIRVRAAGGRRVGSRQGRRKLDGCGRGSPAQGAQSRQHPPRSDRFLKLMSLKVEHERAHEFFNSACDSKICRPVSYWVRHTLRPCDGRCKCRSSRSSHCLVHPLPKCLFSSHRRVEFQLNGTGCGVCVWCETVEINLARLTTRRLTSRSPPWRF